ncbi:sensor histidine kinase [Vallitalea longa]|uniref:sensor histidine kinase n=1 Tax=Vallitalea longa TaxID=2936439 RepID=UPI00249066DA|nr:HAMP domain-containing sensor histidine kinase [Vallitalea longa]
MITTSFASSLDQEILIAYDSVDIVYYSIRNELQEISDMQDHSIFSDIEDLSSVQNEWVTKTAEGLTLRNVVGDMSFRISDKNKKIVFSSKFNKLDNDIITYISRESRGYEIVKNDQEYYIHSVRSSDLLNEQYYIEIFRDVTPIFESRVSQYETFLKIIGVMLLFGCVFTFVICKWLMKPIHKLSRVAREISGGHFEQRVIVKNNDEIGNLANNFNLMAANLEEKINELKEEASKQETFVACFSHELKTPLTSIIGYADMLRSKKMNREQMVLSANYIFEEGKRLESISMKLLEIVILKNSKIILKEISAIDFFESVKGIMIPIFQKQNIHFSINAEKANLMIEPELMKTVCINLLDNARKAVESNGQVSLCGRLEENNYIINICDNGKGIEQNELNKITQAFYMVDKSRARIQGGIGLGLTICDEIIKLHGGTLKFQSTPQKGTCVFISLKGADAIE